MEFASESMMQMAEGILNGQRDVGDNKLIVRFENRSIEDKAETARQGKPTFKDVLHIHIRVPGQKEFDVYRRARIGPMDGHDNNRFPRQYDAFLRGQQPAKVGTPLREWPGCTASQVDTLAYMNTYTVEELAGLSDGAGQGLMGFQALRQKARDWLAVAKDQSAVTQMRAELQSRDSQIAALQAQMAELLAATKAANDNREAKQPAVEVKPQPHRK